MLSVAARTPPRDTAGMAISASDAPATDPGRSSAAAARDHRFEDVVLPHLDADHGLARWVVRNEHDSQDVVQEALLRALRYFGTFTGGNGRAWFLRIVRHVCWSRRAGAMRVVSGPFDEGRHGLDQSAIDPEARLMQIDNAALIDRAMRTLPDRSRQLLVLRELEGLAYQELADLVGVPMGTVMSGLSRARQALRAALRHELKHADAYGIFPAGRRLG